ncbi:hypothetical protein H8356DRAFT_1350433 [Neocallimastix lanati (nom. inval.)]|nr:hypothetical protein H8356DRAFT_1350433 [Neocallimastix sp. JGI-2020a]
MFFFIELEEEKLTSCIKRITHLVLTFPKDMVFSIIALLYLALRLLKVSLSYWNSNNTSPKA